MTNVTEIDIGGIIAGHRRWFMFLGLALVVAGLLAIAFPLAGSLAVEVWAAIALIIAGVAQCAHAFAARGWQGIVYSLAIGVLYLVTGVMLWLNPMKGIVTLTVLLAASILIDGVLTTMLAFRIRGHDGWFWMLISGIVGIVVAFLIWRQLPVSATWALGTLLGCNLIFSGIAFAALARSAQPVPASGSQRV